MTIDRIVEPAADESAPAGFLSSRTALVTGGARRIGRELALALAGEGVRVVVHYHTAADAARQTVREIEAAGGLADHVAADLADPAAAAALPARAAELCGNPLDILINNAAVFMRGPALATTAAQWDELQAVNLRAPFLLARSFARQLPEGWTGDIINLNDARALYGDAEHLAYAVTKAGLHGLTRSLALVLAPRIAVNELSLGAVMAPDNMADYAKVRRAELPLGRFPNPHDVVSGMMYLLSAASVTGQSLRLDGGQYPA